MKRFVRSAAVVLGGCLLSSTVEAGPFSRPAPTVIASPYQSRVVTPAPTQTQNPPFATPVATPAPVPVPAGVPAQVPTQVPTQVPETAPVPETQTPAYKSLPSTTEPRRASSRFRLVP